MNEQNALLEQAEFNVLKAQVRPHFLFNILGIISALTRTNVEKSRSVIKDLAGFLRKTLNREKQIITLEEELDTVHMYLRLEQCRYGERIKVEEKIPHHLLKQRMPIFSLQPLVENAITHGLSRKRGGGTIKIAAKAQEDLILLSIQDDGVGIPKNQLAALLKNKPIFDGNGGTRIGIKNVHFRLQRLYGEEYGLTIESREREGTKVLMRLPYCTEDFDDSDLPLHYAHLEQ